MRLKEKGEIIDMNKNTKRIMVGIAGAMIILLAVASLWYDWKENGNCVTMIAGLWSAAATAILGGIAYWQNKKYKQLADQQNDLAFMPDFFISDSFTDMALKANANLFFVVRGVIDDIETCRCGSIMLFFIKGPVLNLKVTEIWRGEKYWKCSENGKKTFRDESKPISLDVDIPKKYAQEDSSFTAVLEYENVYGTKYRKKIDFDIEAGNRTPIVHALKKAKRIEEKWKD